MAIVQAPQDYRDGDENLFKGHVPGRVSRFLPHRHGHAQRTQRHHQHGTMTMVRRSVLEEVEGWAEWCITEDAEARSAHLRAGLLRATYIPHSYGKGLMPDTFLDFKKQRFRWAYGAVLIMRQHLAAKFGLENQALTWGQRTTSWPVGCRGWPMVSTRVQPPRSAGAAAMVLYPESSRHRM